MWYERSTHCCCSFSPGSSFGNGFGSGTRDPFNVLGEGRALFGHVVRLQFFGIYLFLPAMTCGVITAEKERNSLGLLFLTRLGPWTIVFEKLASRLVPMFTFLLLSLPVLAFAYSLGGISQQDLWLAVWYLTITVVQVGALGIMCSALCRTTAAALIACYLFAITMYLGPALLEVVGVVRWDKLLSPLLEPLGVRQWGGARTGASMLLAGLATFIDFARWLPASAMMVLSIPIVISIIVLLGLTRFFLVRRAFVQPRHALIRLFKRLDTLFMRVNENRLTRGIVLRQDEPGLPVEQPVAWRETTKKSLGTTRYLFRVLVALELPAALFCLLITVEGTGSNVGEVIVAVVFLFWMIALLIVTAASTNLVAAERARQTFDILLATPLCGRELIEQKLRGVQRLIVVASVPLATLLLLHAAWLSGEIASWTQTWQEKWRPISQFAMYCTVSVMSVLLYPRLACWLALIIGLKVRSPMRAVLGSVAVVAAWLLFPYIAMFPFVAVWETGPHAWRSEGALTWVFAGFLISPVYLAWITESGQWNTVRIEWPWMMVFAHFAVQGLLLVLLRKWCLHSADRLLGRE